MKQIELTQGKFVIVDDKDFEWLNQYKWSIANKSKSGNVYAATWTNGKSISMHRLIMGCKKGDGKEIDHIDGDGLNNCRFNLRICTKQQNQWHQTKIFGKSKYKGVSWHKSTKKWQAQIKVNGKRHHLGHFKKEINAALAYDKAAKIHFSDFAYLNFPNRQLIVA